MDTKKIISAVTVNLFLAGKAGAAPLVPCGGADDPCQLCDIFTLLNNIFNFIFFDIVPPIAVIAFLIGGVYLFLSGGNPQSMNKAKSILTAAVIGFIIIYGAWLLINVFFTAIGIASWTGLGNWFEYPCQ